MEIKKTFQDKRMNTMVNKIGLPENLAEWCLEKNKKYSIWIANQLIKINHKNKDVFYEFENNINTIIDWKKEVQGINLNDYNLYTALKEAREFQKSLFTNNDNSLTNTNVILDCGDYKWVQLITKYDCIEEGNAMGHCIGNSSHSSRIASGNSIAFSLRDKFNKPHLTLEASISDKEIFEFKGNSNNLPKKEYLNYFAKLNEKYNFLTITDSTIKSFEYNVNAVEEISKINKDFFSFDFKIRIGLLPFSEGESYFDLLTINIQDREINIPDNVEFYNSIEIISNDNISLGNNLLIGGNLSLKTNKKNKIKLGNNIGIGGNVYLSSNLKKHQDLKNIECFGEIFYIDFD